MSRIRTVCCAAGARAGPGATGGGARSGGVCIPVHLSVRGSAHRAVVPENTYTATHTMVRRSHLYDSMRTVLQ